MIKNNRKLIRARRHDEHIIAASVRQDPTHPESWTWPDDSTLSVFDVEHRKVWWWAVDTVNPNVWPTATLYLATTSADIALVQEAKVEKGMTAKPPSRLPASTDGMFRSNRASSPRLVASQPERQSAPRASLACPSPKRSKRRSICTQTADSVCDGWPRWPKAGSTAGPYRYTMELVSLPSATSTS